MSIAPEAEVVSQPYNGLTPDCVFEALDSVGLHGDGRLLALNSYENRVYQVGIEDELEGSAGKAVIAKFYRPGRWSTAAILEEHEFVHALVEHEIPVVAPLQLDKGKQAGNGMTLHEFAHFRFAVYPRCGGRSPEFDTSAKLRWMGRFIGRIHAVGALRPFVERPQLDIASFGEEPRDWLLSHDFIPLDLIEPWRGVVEQALQGVRRCYERAGEPRLLRSHGDCYAGNVLWSEEGKDRGPHFVDFDDSRMAPAVQDLWMLLSGDRAVMAGQLREALAGYADFFTFDVRELHLIEALRTLRLLYYSAWLARRWNDPAFPAAFPWFNTQRYWQDRILEMREQISLMDEPPLWF